MATRRTAALRATLAQSPDVALVAVTHALTRRAFYRCNGECSLQVTLTARQLRGITEAAGVAAFDALHAQWAAQLPADAGELWSWCIRQTQDTLLALMAVSAAHAVDAVREKGNREDHPRLLHAEALAKALDFDMHAWFTPTAANYFGRVKRGFITEALVEAGRPARTRAWAKMKKSDLAQLAERELHGTGWLPKPLRMQADTVHPGAVQPGTPPPLRPLNSSGRDRPHRLPQVVRPVSFLASSPPGPARGAGRPERGAFRASVLTPFPTVPHTTAFPLETDFRHVAAVPLADYSPAYPKPPLRGRNAHSTQLPRAAGSRRACAAGSLRRAVAAAPPSECGQVVSEPHGAACQTQRGETTMLLGTFKKTETNGFSGTIRTLTFTAELAFEPNKEKKGDKAPDFRVTADDLEIGGAWMKTSDAGNAYLSVTLDDPTLPAAIDCALVKSGIEHGYNLVWQRRTRKAKSNGTQSAF